ncbi:hypothetical protein [Brevibacillus choshinensis]|nr:hypothetical protein [Brevibacillus choshinensis]
MKDEWIYAPNWAGAENESQQAMVQSNDSPATYYYKEGHHGRYA